MSQRYQTIVVFQYSVLKFKLKIGRFCLIGPQLSFSSFVHKLAIDQQRGSPGLHFMGNFGRSFSAFYASCFNQQGAIIWSSRFDC